MKGLFSKAPKRTAPSEYGPEDYMPVVPLDRLTDGEREALLEFMTENPVSSMDPMDILIALEEQDEAEI